MTSCRNRASTEQPSYIHANRKLKVLGSPQVNRFLIAEADNKLASEYHTPI